MAKKDNKHIDYFSRAKMMLVDSVGRLPTALVIILLGSLAMAGLAGMMMQFAKPPAESREFMPLRLTVVENSIPIDIQKLQGNWVYQTPQFAMTLTLVDDRFDWVIALGDVPDAQFYARGNFRVVGDVLILGVRTDLGIPVDISKPWLKYMPLAMKDLNVKMTVDKSHLNWNVPTSEQKKVFGQGQSIFINHDDGLFEWVRQ